MSRSGYVDDYDYDNWSMIRWRGMVASAMRGKRGQAFLKEMLAALEAMPTKRLIAHELESHGEVCAIGSVGKARGVDMSAIDADDRDTVANTFGIASPMAAEIAWENDECGRHDETPEQRYDRMVAWIKSQIKS